MSDDAPEREDESPGDGPHYRHDALSELMTGAFAATSMVSMSVPGGDANLPAPPAWSPTDDAPKAEALDQASGMPAQIDSGRHSPVEDDIDIDIDDGVPDAVALQANAITVPLAGARRVPPPPVDIIPTDPSDDDVEPAAAISTDSGVIVTHQHAVGAKLTGAYPAIPPHLRSPAPRERSNTPWIVAGLAAVAAVAVGAVLMIGRSEASPNADANDASVQAAVVPEPEPEPAPTELEPATREPTEPAAPEPGEPLDPQSTYAAAIARYDEDPNNDALLDVTLAACALEKGPDARTAFRKLVGSKPRSTAVIECREHGVDVSADVEGYTAAELADQAQAAFDAGKLTEALELAKESNKTERNQPALGLIVRAHCRAKDKAAAKKMMRHISKKHRRTIIQACAEDGVRLR